MQQAPGQGYTYTRLGDLLAAGFVALGLIYSVREHSPSVALLIIAVALATMLRIRRLKPATRIIGSRTAALVTASLFAGPLSFMAVAILLPRWTLPAAAVLVASYAAMAVAGRRVRLRNSPD